MPNNHAMLQASGQIQNTGRYSMRKSYLVTDSASLTSVPEIPPLFRPTAISWQAIGPNIYEKTVEFESFVRAPAGGGIGGGGGGGGGVVENLAGVEGRFELDTQDELYPIEGHPNIETILKKYSGKIVDGKAVFEQKYNPGGSSGLEGGSGQKGNPMFGKKYYTKPTAIFRHIQQTQSIPSDVWNNVGKQVSSLPAGFPNPPADTNEKGEPVEYSWICMSPQIYRRGNAYEIIRSYKLSDPNSPKELYKKTSPSSGNPDGGVPST